MADDVADSAGPLAPEVLAEVHRALLDAYPNFDDLVIRLAFKWGVRLHEVVFLEQPTSQVVFKLLEWTEAQNSTRELVGLAWTGRTGNVQLAKLAERLLGDLGPVRARYAIEPPRAPAAGAAPPAPGALEKTVTPRSTLIDFATYAARLAAVRKSICRVETAFEIGTGFLIGRRTVLTNWHVVEKAHSVGEPGERVACRFDYTGGEGVTRHCADAEWLVDHSLYSDSDMTGRGEPNNGELDFAVLRLGEAMGEEYEPLALSREQPIVAPLDVAFILQHPGGEPLKVAMGTIVEFPATGLRYRYNVTTRPGSSGAPVLSAALALIGLHHAADPASQPQYNQAVPCWRIARRLEDQGKLVDIV